MTTQILRTVAAGVLAGIALFMVPFFLIKVLIFFLLIKAIFRLLGWRRRHWGGMRYAYAHKFQNMSEEDRKAFEEKYGRNCGCYYNYKDQPESGKTNDNPNI
jgi:hypothetical protein